MTNTEKLQLQIPFKPRAGVYGNDEVYKAYKELYEAVHSFMYDVNQDCSHGALQLGGVGARAKARAKALVFKARNLEEIMKATCTR